ncbi:MAG: cupin domain-containing protein [Methylococcaceae bacterium]|nr:cupin domain-containing protein [Methylococcaceae bacterium]
MNINSSSIFADIPKQLPLELCQTLLTKPNVRIERIISKGHSSADGFWYDQTQDEWVILLQGRARLSFRDTPSIELNAGDYLLIPAHYQHRVDWTAPDVETIWLAIHIFDRVD